MSKMSIEYNNTSIILLVVIIVMISYILWISRRKKTKVRSTQTKYLDDLIPATWSGSNQSLAVTVPSTNMTKKKLIEEIFFASHHSADDACANRCMNLLQRSPETVNYRLEPCGYTPFLDACWAGSHKLVEYMLQHGADVEITGNDGDSAFYLATFSYVAKAAVPFNPALLQALINFGCSINRPKKNGLTPLHIAAKMGRFEIVRWLLVHRADAGARTGRGRTPADIAQANGNPNIAKYLMVQAAKPSPIPETPFQLLLPKCQSRPSSAQSGGSSPKPDGSKPEPDGSKPKPSPVVRPEGSPDLFHEDSYYSDE